MKGRENQKKGELRRVENSKAQVCVEEEINCIVKYSLEEEEEEEVMKDNDRFVPIKTEIICISINDILLLLFLSVL